MKKRILCVVLAGAFLLWVALVPNKEKLPLADLVMPKSGSLTLLFPRETAGKPWITPEDKEIALLIRIGENDYKFVFKLENMVVNGTLEI